MGNIDQDFENILPAEEKPKKKTPSRKIVFLGGLLLLFFLILILIAIFLNLRQRRSFFGTLPTPTPTPTPILVEEITNPSFYATDSGILKIEEELKKIEGELDSTDLKQASLSPPLLDWEVKF